jgi:hypothetical protein
MSDDRRSPEELEIAEAALTAPPPPRRTEPTRCGAAYLDRRCHRAAGHDGAHSGHGADGHTNWVDSVGAEEIEEFMKKLEEKE